MISKHPVNTALLRRLGWIDNNENEVHWQRYVKPDGFYKDDDEEEPRSKKFSKRSKRIGGKTQNSSQTDTR